MLISFEDFIKNYKNIDFIIKEDENFYYFWKKHGIASSFGKEENVLNLIDEEQINNKDFIKNQKNNFTKEDEFGLLNRLDNETAGFLYFAKNKETYKNYKQLQKENKIIKTYCAIIEGNFSYNFLKINSPIMHKNKSKMIVIKDNKDKKKGRGKMQYRETLVEKIKFYEKLNITYLKIKIKKGIRHQIRIHLQSIGHPIIGDKLYGNGKGNLELYSLGFSLKNS